MLEPSPSGRFDFRHYRVVIAGGSPGAGRSMALAFARSRAALFLGAGTAWLVADIGAGIRVVAGHLA